jgi:hypothetical protein
MTKQLSDQHKCPIDNCAEYLPSHILMCRRHWYQVPPHLRQGVYQTWCNGKPANLQDYLTARTEAVRSVNLLMGGSDRNS